MITQRVLAATKQSAVLSYFAKEAWYHAKPFQTLNGMYQVLLLSALEYTQQVGDWAVTNCRALLRIIPAVDSTGGVS